MKRFNIFILLICTALLVFSCQKETGQQVQVTNFVKILEGRWLLNKDYKINKALHHFLKLRQNQS